MRKFGTIDSKYALEETAPGFFRVLHRDTKESLGTFSVQELMQLSLTIDALIDSTYDLSKGGVWPAIAEPSKKKS